MLSSFIDSRDCSGLLSYVTGLLDAQAENRVDILSGLPSVLSSVPFSENSFVDQACSALIEVFRSRMNAPLEEIDMNLRKLLYDTCWAEGKFSRAGGVLGLAKIDSHSVPLSNSKRALYWLETAKAYYKAEDYLTAERYLKKAGEWVKSGGDLDVLMLYKTLWAQLLDYGAVGGVESRKKFLDASLKYGEVSRAPESIGYDEGELLDMLTAAVRCALLAPVNPSQQRIMKALLRDDRIALIPATTHAMLLKMCGGEIIYKSEADDFESTLPPHCQCRDSQNRTIFARALAEHNVLAVSRVYRNISFSGLGALLGLSAGDSEAVVSKMVSDGRLAGASIDQVDGVLDFTAGGRGGGERSQGDADPDAQTLLKWDMEIKNLCAQVNSVVEGLSKMKQLHAQEETFA